MDIAKLLCPPLKEPEAKPESTKPKVELDATIQRILQEVSVFDSDDVLWERAEYAGNPEKTTVYTLECPDRYADLITKAEQATAKASWVIQQSGREKWVVKAMFKTVVVWLKKGRITAMQGEVCCLLPCRQADSLDTPVVEVLKGEKHMRSVESLTSPILLSRGEGLWLRESAIRLLVTGFKVVER
ncbi:uncharacterized protein B0I36DRAFT_350536 [Microdochium trichocladiopsis]|uniref:Uncharacterized protein n=1 Tax=Microdochium trichocladiopsis TaxID=1682393 RepID=A0A9P9BMK5_9PEZI|nr:uncharacterized protein B0I36DRAFT_350536 [Microdochium trichocladiopsis]KAH7029708.1 hypothetical protein B0I36DRAFT_350536 [Microdochium trichocladiopsis]